MRNHLLSVALIAAPVAAFIAAYALTAPATVQAAASAPLLGDMTAFETISADDSTFAATGDLAAAKTRIMDLETARDDAEPALSTINPAQWGNVDTAIDAALTALRARQPDAAVVTASLATLTGTLADPSAGAVQAGQGALMVQGIAVTDENSHALPCETMLATFRIAADTATLSDADRATVTDFETRGTERCNADDDTRVDVFFAQGLALISTN